MAPKTPPKTAEDPSPSAGTEDVPKTAEEAKAAEEKAKKNGTKPLLDLDLLDPERPTIRLSGKTFEFRIQSEFGLAENHRWTRDTQNFDELWNKDHPTKNEQEKMQRLLDRLFDTCLVDPEALRKHLGKRLSGSLMREIVVLFSNASWLMQSMTQEEDETTLSTSES